MVMCHRRSIRQVVVTSIQDAHILQKNAKQYFLHQPKLTEGSLHVIFMPRHISMNRCACYVDFGRHTIRVIDEKAVPTDTSIITNHYCLPSKTAEKTPNSINRTSDQTAFFELRKRLAFKLANQRLQQKVSTLLEVGKRLSNTTKPRTYLMPNSCSAIKAYRTR